MLIYGKLKEIRSKLNLTQKDIQSETGLSQRDISQLENGKKQFIPISYIQFLNKRGVSLKLLYDENVSIDNFIRDCLVSEKDTPINNSLIQPVISETKTEKRLIPYFDAIAEAGTMAVADMSAQYPASMVDTGDFFQDANAIMQVHGDSMYPDYKPGSLIALKEVYNKRLIMFGEDYVIETSEYRVIKRIQKSDDKTCWLACSTNTDVWEQGKLKGRLIHEPFDVPIDEVMRIYLVLGEIHRKHNNRIIHSK